MKKLILISFVVAVALTTVAQQSDFSKLRGPYLGQNPPGITPEIFAPGIISTEQFEFGGTFSPDGNEFLFTRRSDYNGSKNRIYFTRLLYASKEYSNINIVKATIII